MQQAAQYKGNDKLLFGIILGVLAFWLFAQTILNINVDMAKDLKMKTSIMSIAVSITSLIILPSGKQPFSHCYIIFLW